MITKFTFGASATGWNNYVGGRTAGQTIVADLLDDAGSATGIALVSTTATTYSSGNRASGDLHGWPDAVWDSLSFNDPVELGLSGLTSYIGQTFTIEVAGYGDNTVETDFTIDGTTTRYSSAATTPPAPTSFTGTIAGDTLSIAGARVGGGAALFTGFTLELTAAVVTTPTLTGPSSVTEGTSTATVGTGQDTVTTLSIQTTDAAFSVEQTKGATTATGITFTPASGINACSIGFPAAGVPLVPTVSAAGITAYATEIKEV